MNKEINIIITEIELNQESMCKKNTNKILQSLFLIILCSLGLQNISVAQITTCTSCVTSRCLECDTPNKRFLDELIFTSTATGERWEILSATGFYQDAAGVSLVGDTLEDLGNKLYRIQGWVDADSTFSVVFADEYEAVFNPDPDTIMYTLSSDFTCSFPDTRVYGDDDVCNNSMHSYSLNINPNDLDTITWTIQPLAGRSFVGDSINTHQVKIQWDSTGTYTIYYEAVETSNVNNPSCMIVDSLVVEVIDYTDITLACNDLTNVSLGDDCMYELTPDIILEGQIQENDAYDVILKDLNNNNTIIPDATVTDDHLGKTLLVSIEHECSANSCWGYIRVEDKIPPDITDCMDGYLDDVEVECSDNIEPGKGATNYPGVSDLCSGFGSNKYDFFDLQLNETMCEDSLYISIIERNWTITDAFGTKSKCKERILVKRAVVDSIDFPEDVVLSCEGPYNKLSNGHPDPSSTGKPEEVNCINLAYHFSDQEIPVCGATTKFLRTWTVLDWCSGNEALDIQIIKIEDNKPPQVTAPVDGSVKAKTVKGECAVELIIPPPIEIFDCSGTSVQVGYKPQRSDQDLGTFETFFTEGVEGPDAFGNFRVPHVEVVGDSVWIAYRVTDECGYFTDAFTEILIEDEEPPSAICESHTIVSLKNDGWAEMKAYSLDDHSYDNCGDVDSFLVKKMAGQPNNCAKSDDFEFGSSISFCCDDVGNTIKTVLRVFDKQGLYSDCVVEITIQNKYPFTVQCPPTSFTISCTDDIDDLSLTGGSPTASGVCEESIQITYTNAKSLNSCGVGSFRRNWRITDGSTNRFCSQVITVEGKGFTSDDIVWPTDEISLPGCSVDDAPVEMTGKPYPRVGTDQCIELTIGYDDQIFYNVNDDFCKKIVRTWTVIDWCSYNRNNPSAGGRWTRTQKIILTDALPPSFTSSCSDKVVNANNNTCEGYMDLIASATDNCDNPVTISYELDLYYVKSQGFNPGARIYSNDASDTYPVGTHRIRFYAMDECGNESKCEYNFTIRDNKAPNAVCVTSLTFPLPETKEITIWASEFEASSTDNCHDTNLFFSFSRSTSNTNKKFTCSDIDDGAYMEKDLQVYVTDPDGNFSYCDVKVIITDNKNVCPDAASSFAKVTGLISKEDHSTIKNVMVILENRAIEKYMERPTNESGLFEFDGLPMYRNYMIKPKGEAPAMDGVSTLDIVLMQNHILGIKEFSSPYKLIAADVNRSGSISAVDLLVMRKLILGLTDEFPMSDSWSFVEAGYTFPDPEHPYNYPESLEVQNLMFGESDINFVAIKMGDVSGNAGFNNPVTLEVRNAAQLPLVLAEQFSGDKKTIKIKADEQGSLYGMQFTIEFDPAQMTFENILSNKLNISNNHFSLMRLEQGIITLSWNGLNAVELSKGDVLFELEFNSSVNIPLEARLEINSSVTTAEAYDGQYEAMEVVTRYENANEDAKGMVLYQNRPNPFSLTTNIGFKLPESGNVKLEVYDLQGKVIFKQEGNYPKGYNEIELHKEQLGSKGILYYRLEAKNHVSSKKMVILE